MAQIRWRRVPELALHDLQDSDLRVLDFALSRLVDAYRDGKHHLTIEEEHSLRVMHRMVLLMKIGDGEVEESETDR